MAVVALGPAPYTIDRETIVARALDWLSEQRLEELQPVEVPPHIVPPGNGDVLYGLFPADNPLKIEVRPRFERDRLSGYSICPSGYVGVMAVGEDRPGRGAVTLSVLPKIPDASLLTMLSYAFFPDLEPPEPAVWLAEKPPPLVSLVALLYLHHLQQTVQRHGLPRDYSCREAELRGTVRGRCLLGSYLGRHIPRGKPQVVPCRFWEFTVDSKPNRALRWGIEVCRRLADQFAPSGLASHVHEVWIELAPYFDRVRVTRTEAFEVRQLPRSGRFAPYREVFAFLELLLSHSSLDLSCGQIRARGFGIEMWEVFQRFAINVLRGRLRHRIDVSPRYSYEVKTERQGETAIVSRQQIVLDALVQGPRRLVLDAKWKEAITAQTMQEKSYERSSDVLYAEDLHIRNADLFQVVAYGRHRQVQAQGGILVYPVLGAEAVCRQRCILDFEDVAGRPFPIFLLGIPVGVDLEKTVGDFVKQVGEILKGTTPS